MKRTSFILIVVVLTLLAPRHSSAQYFQQFHDFDSSFDWGYDIISKADGNLLILGTSSLPLPYPFINTSITLSSDGSTILSKKDIRIDSVGVFINKPHSFSIIDDSDYIIPLTLQCGYPLRSFAGVTKITPSGDTLFLRKYTDTSVNFEALLGSATSPNRNFFCGYRKSNSDTLGYSYSGLLIATNNLGDTIWTRTYRNGSIPCWITSIVTLPNGGAVLQGMVIHYSFTPICEFEYSINNPWFITIDSSGNIVKDTVYEGPYGGNNLPMLYRDPNGGYIQTGELGYIYTCYPQDPINFPDYITHLDTNFNFNWFLQLDYHENSGCGHRLISNVKTLHDNNFLLIGDGAIDSLPLSKGWLAKVSSSGELLWTHEYYSDLSKQAYLRDATELTNGNIIAVGSTFNDTLPSWHSGGDIWLVGVDSNGCEIAGCGPDTSLLGVVQPAQVATEIKLYPNPTTGTFTLQCPIDGALLLYAPDGRMAAQYTIHPGTNEQQLPRSLSPGIYIGVFRPADGSPQKTVRLVYEP